MTPADRPGRRAVRLAAAAVALIAGLAGLAGCTRNGGTSNGAGHSSGSAVSPQFATARSSIDGYTDLKGNKFIIRGDPGGTGLVLRDGRIVRGNPSNTGSRGAPIAVIPNRAKPAEVSMSFVLTPGSTQGQNAVLGSCAVSFAKSSIQLATFPDQWRLFYTEKRTDGGGTDIVTIAQGSLGPLKTDGSTVYTESMKVDLASSSVQITVPGVTRTVSDPHIARFWGSYTGIQIRHPASSDGDVQITARHECPELAPASGRVASGRHKTIMGEKEMELWDRYRQWRVESRINSDAIAITFALVATVAVLLFSLKLAHRHHGQPTAETRSPIATTTSATTAPSPSTSPASSQFAKATSNLDGYTDASGNKFIMRGDPGNTGLEVSDGRIVRAHPANSGATGGPIAVFPNRSRPSAVSISFVFTPGTTDKQNVVVGTCAVSFADSSIQLATAPDQWTLFYTQKRTDGNGTDLFTIAQGDLGPLKTDGSTVYTSSIKVDLATSSADVTVPGASLTIKDPHIAQFWGSYTGLQIRHPRASDGDAQITAVSSTVN